jgi:hypothetical protein
MNQEAHLQYRKESCIPLSLSLSSHTKQVFLNIILQTRLSTFLLLNLVRPIDTAAPLPQLHSDSNINIQNYYRCKRDYQCMWYAGFAWCRGLVKVGSAYIYIDHSDG